MFWTVKIHRLVIEEDLKKIDPQQVKRIKKDIKKKLATHPTQYGEDLGGPFKKYRKLAVGEYRVIYRVIEDKVLVLVLKVGIRRDYEVYEELFHRLKKLNLL